MVDSYRIKLIKQASLIAIIGNGILAVLKISVGCYFETLSVIGDGVDSSSDIILSLATFFATTIIAMPADKKHSYGHSRAETLTTTILSFIIFFAGIQLSYSSILRIFSKEVLLVSNLYLVSIIVFSILGKFFLSLVLNKYGKKTDSSMIIANAKNMQSDILISFAVLVGIVFTFYFKNSIIDSVIAFLIGLWIIKTGLTIFIEMKTELMDGCSDPDVYEKIFEAVNSVGGAFNPHRVRVRKLANMYVIDLDVEVDPNLTVFHAHEIAVNVEDSIQQSLLNVYDIVVHIEPIGNVENEKYGLSSKDLDGNYE